MMSHSNPQPQKRRLLSQFLFQQLNEHPENSVSSSQTHHTNSSCSTQFQTPITASAGRPTRKLFLVSSDHHHQSDQCQNQSPPVSCCFNVSSRCWSRFKLNCSDVSSMASQVESAVLHSTSEIIKKITGQQKGEELEREVSKLQKLLYQEEKVHEILEMVHNRPNVSATSIPNYLPPKMKELLAELVMVESEIARLENQISQLQAGLEQEQEFNQKVKLKTWNQGNSHNSISHLSVTENPSLTCPLHRSIQETTAFETEALHFINKAMKGDRNLGDLGLNEKTGYLRNFVEQKGKHCCEDDLMFQVGIPRKSATVKHASPLRHAHQYHPSTRLREQSQEMFLDLPTKSLLDPLLSEENNLKWQPNKLSESIMKCLNFIYVRLLRTSRTMELEKSGSFSRSVHSSLSSRSFRVESSSNPISSLMLLRESRQQDPYGIFDTEESIPRDIGPYKNLVIFTSSSMDPKFISSPSSIPLLRKLRVLMINLQTVDLRSLTYQQKLAFWINMYNACIMHGFIQYGVPSYPEKLRALMNKATLNVGGHKLNALAIEHFILRKQAASNMKEVHMNGVWQKQESVVRELYGFESMNPNVTFALCCGTRSSPARVWVAPLFHCYELKHSNFEWENVVACNILHKMTLAVHVTKLEQVKIYTADSVAAELERSKLDYLQASIMVTSTRRIAFPELLLKSMLDFAKDKDSLVEWVCHQLPASGTLRKSMVDCFKSHHNTVKASSTVEKIPYDYEFQYLLTI